MKIPFWNATITLYKRMETTENGKTKVFYKRHVLNRCFWRRGATRYLNDMDAVRSEEIICRVPDGQIAPEIGDFMFKGSVELADGDSRSLVQAMKDRHETGAMKVSSVSVNVGIGMPIPHYAARGS